MKWRTESVSIDPEKVAMADAATLLDGSASATHTVLDRATAGTIANNTASSVAEKHSENETDISSR